MFAQLTAAENNRYECCFSSDSILSASNNVRIKNRFIVTVSPLRLHSASSVQIPHSTSRFNSLLPTVNVTSLKIHSVSSINLHGASNNNIFRMRIRLSPLKSPILQKSL